ncbi:protein FAM207A isoform X2 [Ailuropoda melanoleuca]|uniref:protein FAM207A isoform X2 n=1 Tax=Ailuropoda melanoleuca TaxID=9646 RepID=UPI0014945A89|nr:protein FAM207A isoform X2 [Ailuropoda melanoleuca]
MKGPTQCCVPTGLPAASALELSQPPAPVSRLLLLHRGHRGISLGSPVPPQAPEGIAAPFQRGAPWSVLLVAHRGAGQEWAFMNTDVFAGTKIDPGVLVQKLDPDTRSVASIRRGAEARAVLPKKEKLKLRRERWLQTFQGETWHRANEQTRERRARIFHVQQALGLPAVPLEIEAIKLAEQKRKAERRRRATVVVGDLQPLRDALPELLELEAGSRQRRARGVSSRPRPSELSRMSAAQRLQLLEEERARFRELLASPTYRASPLLAIGQQLAQQMQLDGGSEL